MPYAAAEQPFAYRLPAAWDKGPLGPDEALPTFRYHWKDYPRAD